MQSDPVKENHRASREVLKDAIKALKVERAEVQEMLDKDFKANYKFIKPLITVRALLDSVIKSWPEQIRELDLVLGEEDEDSEDSEDSGWAG